MIPAQLSKDMRHISPEVVVMDNGVVIVKIYIKQQHQRKILPELNELIVTMIIIKTIPLATITMMIAIIVIIIIVIKIIII